VLLLASAAAAWWSFVEPSRALWVAVSVLIVTCPCALSLATPATLVAAAGGLARRGVLLRRLEALETMAAVRHVALDKTGTLTEDRLHWTATELGDGAAGVGILSPAQALQQAASLARWSRHPASAALVEAAEAAAGSAPQGVDGSTSPAWSSLNERPGFGVEAVDAQGRRWRLGAAAWAVARAQPMAEGLRPVLGCEGAWVAGFRLEETVRPDAAAAVASLVQDGLSVELLSGDAPERAEALARRLGIVRAQGGLDPEGKGRSLRALQSGGVKVAMVGDGINDAPVLAAADVSLAMGHAALAARQGADAVLVGGRLAGLSDLQRTARCTLRIVRQNLAWSVAYNASCVPLAMMGWLPPWAAGLGMAASSLLVILNAQRAAAAPAAVPARVPAPEPTAS
jgi:Cu2+-exporting ATPase